MTSADWIAQGWEHYTLLDSGWGNRFEAFGPYFLIRPDSAANHPSQLSLQQWKKEAHAHYIPETATAGHWEIYRAMPNTWDLEIPVGPGFLMELKLTRFKHVGLFPEQFPNWNFVFERLQKIDHPKFLNVFAYTGAASIAARLAGADVVHVEALKQLVDWSARNQKKSGLDGIRWVVDDALAFMLKEKKRGKVYHGIVMDPPAFGRAPNGKHWNLSKHLPQLLETAQDLLHPNLGFLILNTYTQGISTTLVELLNLPAWAKFRKEHGTLFLEDLHQQCVATGWLTRIQP